MSYSYVYLADAKVPADRMDAWLDTTLESVSLEALEALEDWGLELSGTVDTVSELLDAMEEEELAAVELGTTVSLRILAAKDGDAWLTYRGDLAASFLALAGHGGRGRLDIVGFEDGPDDGFRIEVGEKAKVTELSAEQVAAVRESGAYEEVLEIVSDHYGESDESDEG